MIKGNINATVRYVKSENVTQYGEKQPVYENYAVLNGFIDRLQAEVSRDRYNMKSLDEKYIFICDYVDLSALDGKNCSAVIGNDVYDIVNIDNPGNLNRHIEIEMIKTGAVIYG